MQWIFTFEEHPLLLNIKVTGQIQKGETAKMAIDGFDLARQKECTRFLIDLRDANLKVNQSDIFDFNSNLEKTGLKRTDKIAIVILQNIEIYRFAEMVANNRGWTRLKYFEDLREAREWVK